MELLLLNYNIMKQKTTKMITLNSNLICSYVM